MLSSVKRRDGTLLAMLEGEIDEHSAARVRERLDKLLADPGINRIEFDLSKVTLMDSSGIGMLLGRYRRLRARGGSMDVEGATGAVERVLRMSGVYRLCTKGDGSK